MSEHDPVNKPSHYQIMPGVEVYDVRMALMGKIDTYNIGAVDDWSRAWEYLTRMWGKNGLEDAKKARWYLDKLIGKLEKESLPGDAKVPTSCPFCGRAEGQIHHPDCHLLRCSKSTMPSYYEQVLADREAAKLQTKTIDPSAVELFYIDELSPITLRTDGPAAQIDDESDRQQAIQQNGNDGLVYEDPWYGAPEWARFKAQDANGTWYWFSYAPECAEETWCTAGKYATAFACDDDPNPNWRDTLIERTSGQDPQE